MSLFHIRYSGDNAIVLYFEQKIDQNIHANIIAIQQHILDAQHQCKIQGITELIPSYCALLILYNPTLISPFVLCEFLESLQDISVESQQQKRVIIEIPTCYEEPFCMDLDNVAKHTKLQHHEIITMHTEPLYFVYMLGFVAGFPYLGGLNEKLATPRHQKPRPMLEAGSVGIADKQTGIYPIQSPGGWQIIGRTPLRLFNPKDNPPVLLRSGIYLKFKQISCEEFYNLQKHYDEEHK